MKDTIYLVATRHGIARMTKKLPQLSRGEIPVKLPIEIDDAAFREPVLERKVHVTDWREGLDFGDPELQDGIITEAEAQMIVAQRLRTIQVALEERGYTVTAPAADEPA